MLEILLHVSGDNNVQSSLFFLLKNLVSLYIQIGIGPIVLRIIANYSRSL